MRARTGATSASMWEKQLNVTKEYIDSLITQHSFHRIPDTTLTICVITMKNGFHLVGHSACVSAEMFDEGIGKTIAYDNAYRQAWALEGYALRTQLSEVKHDN